MERPDDRRVRARGARARRHGRGAAVSRCRAARRRGSSARRSGSTDERRLLRRYRDGEAAIDGYAEDYAYLDLRPARAVSGDGDPAVARVGDRRCRPRRTACSGMMRTAGWFSTTGSDPSVLLRLKEDYDGAEPAPGSVVGAEPADARIAGRRRRRGSPKAERTLARFGPTHRRRRARRSDDACRALQPGTPSTRRSSSSGHRTARTRSRFSARSPALSAVCRRRAGRARGNAGALATLMPFVGRCRCATARATAYVCRAFTCREPVTDVGARARSCDELAETIRLLARHYTACGTVHRCTSTRPMLYTVEIVLRERDYAVTEEVHHHGNPPSTWTELDVEGVLKSMLAGDRPRQEPRRRAATCPAARLQLDCRADRRWRGDRDGDSERRRRGGPVRHRPAPARWHDHAGPRRRARRRRPSCTERRRPAVPVDPQNGKPVTKLLDAGRCDFARFAERFRRYATGITLARRTGYARGLCADGIMKLPYRVLVLEDDENALAGIVELLSGDAGMTSQVRLRTKMRSVSSRRAPTTCS